MYPVFSNHCVLVNGRVQAMMRVVAASPDDTRLRGLLLLLVIAVCATIVVILLLLVVCKSRTGRRHQRGAATANGSCTKLR